MRVTTCLPQQPRVDEGSGASVNCTQSVGGTKGICPPRHGRGEEVVIKLDPSFTPHPELLKWTNQLLGLQYPRLLLPPPSWRQAETRPQMTVPIAIAFLTFAMFPVVEHLLFNDNA